LRLGAYFLEPRFVRIERTPGSGRRMLDAIVS
jgi:hypothetical protein